MKSELPRNPSRRLKEHLPEIKQNIGLLTPKPLPDMPAVPLELLTGLVTKLKVHSLGQQEISKLDYEAAQEWYATISMPSYTQGSHYSRVQGTTLQNFIASSSTCSNIVVTLSEFS